MATMAEKICSSLSEKRLKKQRKNRGSDEMVLPLYKGCVDNEFIKKYEEGFNAGLWYDKFCNEWSADKWSLKQVGDKNPKKDWIDTVTKSKIGNLSLLSEFQKRSFQLIESLQGSIAVFQTEWRFVSGLGRVHPVENGFAWHQTLGVPYLPGSSVKGLVRGLAQESIDGGNLEEREVLRRIFGSFSLAEDTSSKEANSVGSIVFFDALPVAAVKLETEVMTPHYSEYYRSDTTPPADWLNPEPVYFLTVAPKQNFIFALAPRHRIGEGDLQDAQLALEWLEAALLYYGAGAKTATGYGRFKRNVKIEKDLIKKWQKEKEDDQQRKIMARMTPLQKEMEADGYSTDANRFMEKLTTKWLDHLGSAEVETEKLEIAEMLANWYQENRLKDWEKPSGKNLAKVEKIKQALMLKQ